MSDPKKILVDEKVPIKLKLAGLWCSTMFCYIYNDFFSMFRPGALRMLMTGRGPMGPISQEFLLAATMAVAIPAVMVFASLTLAPVVNKWLNVFFGVLFTIIVGVIAFTPGTWMFYIFMSVVEVVLTMMIAWTALTWPKHNGGEAPQ